MRIITLAPIIIIASLFCFSCSSSKQSSGIYPTAPQGPEPDGISFSTASDQKTNRLWGEGEDADLPAIFEAVCDDDPDRCGNTHIDLDEHFISVKFERFESPASAQEKVKAEARKAGKTLRTGSIKDQTGQIVGQKVIIQAKLDGGQTAFLMLWTRGSRFAQIRSDSIEGIEKYEKDRGL